MTREEFVQKRMDQYQEPTRKGTPKGRPIGLSRDKYHAALALMDCSSVRSIKRRFHLQASEGLIYKWRTEEEFRRVSKDANREWFKLNGWGSI